jgi:hypothetical protein
MRTRKLSIAALMVLVLFAGVGLAALARPSRLAAASLFSGALGALTVALVGTIWTRGLSRAFWSGFALGGGTYLLLQYGPFCETQVGPYTLPTAAIDLLYAAISPPERSQVIASVGTWGGSVSTGTTVPSSAGIPAGGNTTMTVMAAGGSGYLAAPPAPPLSPWQAWTAIDQGQGWTGTATPQSFYRIAHSLLAVLFGLVTGLLAVWWWAYRPSSQEEGPTPVGA